MHSESTETYGPTAHLLIFLHRPQCWCFSTHCVAVQFRVSTTTFNCIPQMSALLSVLGPAPSGSAWDRSALITPNLCSSGWQESESRYRSVCGGAPLHSSAQRPSCCSWHPPPVNLTLLSTDMMSSIKTSLLILTHI